MAFSFLSYLVSFQRYSRFFVLCKLGTDDVIRCDNMEVKTQNREIHLFFNASIFHFIGTLNNQLELTKKNKTAEHLNSQSSILSINLQNVSKYMKSNS